MSNQRGGISFARRPSYCGRNNNGRLCTSYNSRNVHGNEGWPRHLSYRKENFRKEQQAVDRETCVSVAGKILCFATMAAAAAYLYSLSSGGRRTRKQYKKRSTRSLSK